MFLKLIVYNKNSIDNMGLTASEVLYQLSYSPIWT